MSSTSPPASTVVHHEMQDWTALVAPGLSPLGARRRNLVMVSEALTAAGVRHFAVRGLHDLASAVGVDDVDRERALDALAGLAASPVAYVRQVVPHDVGQHRLMDGSDPATWRRLADARVLRLAWFQTDAAGATVLGPDHGCDVEFWTRGDHGDLVGPRPNRVSLRLADAPLVPVDADAYSRLAPVPATSGSQVPTHPDMAVRLPEDVTFPIDLVYTWVDGTDPAWGRRRAETLGEAYHAESSSSARYLSRDELRYSLRSVDQYAPWVRKIFVVTDDQRPAWLVDHPRVEVVDHREVFERASWLPTYNSHAIESQLHHIEGLSEHFLYLNDDMFFGRPVVPNAFFHANGLSMHFPSMSRIPQGPITGLDTPVDAACKNNRALLERDFGPVIVQSMQHVPYALRRSVLEEMQERYPQAYEVTAASRFRSPSDHSFTSSFHQYYSFLTGRGTRGSVRYGYIQLAVPDLSARLQRLLARRDWDTFCLNDAFSADEELEAQTRRLREFFEAYYPAPAPWEAGADAS
ncbi:stealth family protein [Phycicoccus sp. DTK01]|uniref:stealth family protein n=1 Tax=Phycicoccus sp. DTK01 TaxID=2785745 RepID=UPI001A8DF541|nr:stealth family protein [Phycicoccus sp. DTK01]GIL34748.1 exopolysaccharide phosphotransferase [Phycicoccus sp. DTK01]